MTRGKVLHPVIGTATWSGGSSGPAALNAALNKEGRRDVMAIRTREKLDVGTVVKFEDGEYKLINRLISSVAGVLMFQVKENA